MTTARMSLPEYIRAIGDEAAAIRWGVRPRTIASWRLRQRFPRPAQAKVIVTNSDGLVDWRGIYDPAFSSARQAS